MYQQLIALRDKNNYGTGAYDPTAPYDQSLRAKIDAFLYILTGDDSYAQEAKTLIEARIDDRTSDYAWADPSVKGLGLYWMANTTSSVFDWCYNAPSWQDEVLTLQSVFCLRENWPT